MTKKQPITHERALGSARGLRVKSLSKVSPQRFKLIIEAAVGEFYLAEQMVKAPRPCRRPGGGKGDGCFNIQETRLYLVTALVRPDGEFGAPPRPKEFCHWSAQFDFSQSERIS